MEADKIKESIKRSARDLFRRYGYNKTSVNEIAKRAKIAKATIYKYFDSKELVLHAILMDYIRVGVDDLVHNPNTENDQEIYLSNLILKVSRLTYTICNEFIGWDFIRESANAQEYLKTLSDDLENLLINSFKESNVIDPNIPKENLVFLIKSSKSIVFSFAFTAVSVADVRKNFISFQKELLPYLVKATVV
ncbi:TetR/AcrR family transcriptional regulator [Olivibacter domesticus]|uniref:Transcriptional regulator, TetR family n=1 Tax=Olivibacter domesticus TaxID=407022 RepID=A0A1H7VT65_OLID1|nr:TetR/AcrR family transcriptional regulator [Olivibacter domesticus]SEM12463.1 transcriptional regulator, TetR family [Olivibacter domesticus]